MKILFHILLAILFIGFVASSCQKDELMTDEGVGISFSTDTVYFDTLLSTIGSATYLFKIYNPHDRPIEISKLYLARGAGSYFRLNVDGTQGNEFHDLRLEANDSMFVFAAITVDPLNENNPVVIKDSVVCITNNKEQDVKFIAYGQDVHIYRQKIFKTETWTPDKPYLIESYAVIDSNETLTIEAGTRIYLTNNSSLYVWGKLLANGTADAPIYFTGSRFDRGYEDVAGQWGSIYFDQKSTGNKLNHVIIKNAQQGMLVGYPDPDSHTEIELWNCMILNTATVALYTFNGTIHAYNTVIADCGYFALLALMGGNYNFYHCTISNVAAYYPEDYLKYRRQGYPSVYFSNYTEWFDLDPDYRMIDVTYSKDLNLDFYNSIIYGTDFNEIRFDSSSVAGLNYTFNHCLLKLSDDSLSHFDTLQFVSLIRNVDPGFINDSLSMGDYDFQLDSISPALNAGDINIVNSIPGLEMDFNGNPRTADGHPDLGAFERNE
jgi:hypothetical protein